MPAAANPVGQKFGRLTVDSFARQELGGSVWNCSCECGNTTQVRIGKLTMGTTRSCGCVRKETAAALKFNHGHARKNAKTNIYNRWKGMLARCTNPGHKSYKNYGGRGIRVCKRWKRFENFLADMGEAPAGLLIDRKNNNGNYTPRNCRWADYGTSARNRRNTRKKSI